MRKPPRREEEKKEGSAGLTPGMRAHRDAMSKARRLDKMALGTLAPTRSEEVRGEEGELKRQERLLMERLQRGSERGKYGHGLGSRHAGSSSKHKICVQPLLHSRRRPIPSLLESSAILLRAWRPVRLTTRVVSGNSTRSIRSRLWRRRHSSLR